MMTRTQKTTILEMRAEGIPYKAIAEELGMSLGSVRMFVSRHNQTNDRRCEQCGQRLPDKARESQRFCSMKCRTMWWNANPARPARQFPHTCAVCSASFLGVKNSKYCSRACYYTSMHK